MKRKIIYLILFACFITLTACSKNKTNYIMINDFETREDIIYNQYSNFFGEIGLNSDTKYISSGSHSLKLVPIGDVFETLNPPIVYFYIDKEFQDATKYSHIKFDIYNTSLERVNIKFSLSFRDDLGNLMQTTEKNYNLEPNSWNNLLYEIDSSTLSLIFNVKKLENISIRFEQTSNKDTSPTLYLDNLSFRNSDEEFVEKIIELDEFEICSFDKDYQANSFLAYGYGPVKNVVPILSINTDPTYSKEGKSLKMIAPKGLKKENSWPLIEISPKILEKVDFSKYDDNDEIVFDIFNDGSKTMLMSIDFHSSDLKTTYKITIEVKPQVWTNFRIKISTINSTSDPKKLLSENLGFLRICYGEFADREQQTFYFDSFRIEKKD